MFVYKKRSRNDKLFEVGKKTMSQSTNLYLYAIDVLLIGPIYIYIYVEKYLRGILSKSKQKLPGIVKCSVIYFGE